MKLDQMDVATAFLYADLEEETYVGIPEGMAAVGGGFGCGSCASAYMA